MTNELFGIKNGIICHQVNCQDAIGAGISGAIIKAFPIVEKKYHDLFKICKPEELYGKKTVNQVTDTLAICNLYTQYYYGNADKTKEVYTNVEYLINGIKDIATKNPEQNVYIPYKIGCGLAGGNWDSVFAKIQALDLPNLYLLDSLHKKSIPFEKANKDTFSKKDTYTVPPFLNKHFTGSELERFQKDCVKYLARDYSYKTVKVYENEQYVSIVGLKEQNRNTNQYRIEYSYKSVLESFLRIQEKEKVMIASTEPLQEIIKDRNRIVSHLDFLNDLMTEYRYPEVTLLDKYHLKSFKGGVGIQINVDDKMLRYTKEIYDKVGNYFVERSMVEDADAIIKQSGYENMNALSDALIVDFMEKHKKICEIKGIEDSFEKEEIEEERA